MVDARAGLMPADEGIAKHLRSRKKKTYLVANKTDGIDVNTAVGDFYSLGLGEIHPIAASHGRGVTQLIEQSLKPFIGEEEEQVELTEEEANAAYWAELEAEGTNLLKMKKTILTQPHYPSN